MSDYLFETQAVSYSNILYPSGPPPFFKVEGEKKAKVLIKVPDSTFSRKGLLGMLFFVFFSTLLIFFLTSDSFYLHESLRLVSIFFFNLRNDAGAQVGCGEWLPLGQESA